MPDYKFDLLDEPNWTVESQDLPLGSYYVLAWIRRDTIEIEVESKTLEYVTPEFTLERPYTVPPEDRDYAVPRLKSFARQIRDYLVWTTNVEVPLLCKLVGQDLLTTEFYPGEYASSLTWRWGFDHRDPSDFRALIESKHIHARSLLASIPSDSPLDKAICLWSEGFLARSRQITLLRFWGIIEVFAEEHSRETGQMVRGQGKKLKEALQLLADRSPETPEGLIREAYSLRNKVAHGEIGTMLDEKIESILQDIGGLTNRMIETRLPRLKLPELL